MSYFKSIAILSIVLSLFAAPFHASAERSKAFGDFQVHYNALTTDLIEPSVARAYGIIRSKHRAPGRNCKPRCWGRRSQPATADPIASLLLRVNYRQP